MRRRMGTWTYWCAHTYADGLGGGLVQGPYMDLFFWNVLHNR